MNKRMATDFRELFRWVDNEFALNRTDTICDFFPFHAEQMIEANKRKNEEVKGFLKWFEHEIGAEIDAHANKTAVKKYHEHSFNQLPKILTKNISNRLDSFAYLH